jgi:hypothetical protein
LFGICSAFLPRLSRFRPRATCSPRPCQGSDCALRGEEGSLPHCHRHRERGAKEPEMFATAVRWAAKKGKPKMALIDLATPPEQTQSITRAIFDVVREHGPLTISDVRDHAKVRAHPARNLFDGMSVQRTLPFPAFFFPSKNSLSGRASRIGFQWRVLNLSRCGFSSGRWPAGADEQAADEDHDAVDARAAETPAYLRPRRPAQAVPLHHLVHQPQERAAEAQV